MPSYVPESVMKNIQKAAQGLGVKPETEEEKQLNSLPVPDVKQTDDIKAVEDNTPTITTTRAGVAVFNENAFKRASSILRQLDEEHINKIDSLYSELTLTRAQRLVLENWFCGKNLTVIAQACGLTPNVIGHWLRTNADFKKAIELREEEIRYTSRMMMIANLAKADAAVIENVEKGNLKAANLMYEIAGLVESEKSKAVNAANQAQQQNTSIKLVVNLSSHNESLDNAKTITVEAASNDS